MDRVTKLIVIVSNLAALWLLARLVTSGFATILTLTVVAFVASWASATVVGEITTSVVLPMVYFVPAVLFARFGRFAFSDYTIWLAALCGSMLPRSVGSRWAFPGRWKPPLVFWALALALSWPIVVLREVDFVPSLLDRVDIWNSRLGLSPPTVTVWILSVTSIAMSGLLLLDWLFLAYPERRSREFESRIVWPLFAGAGISAAVAVYQSIVNMSFLNHTFFEMLGRAVGTMRDANAFGTIEAMWIPIAAALAIGDKGASRRLRPIWLVVLAVLAISVWGSGSRTALLAALTGVIVMIGSSWRPIRARHVMIAAAGAIVTAAVVVFVLPRSTIGPLARLFIFTTVPDVPSLSIHGFLYTVDQLWTRGGYGTAAGRIIAEHPFVGIGVGGFYYQYADALYLIGGSVLPPDNAQNWFRQQLAELGLLGSAGWIVWTGMFLWMMSRRGPDDGPAMTGAAKGAVIGLGLASLLGMPAQDTAASISFVVIAGWYLKRATVKDPLVRRSRGRQILEWTAILATLLAFLGGTAYAAWTDLRPPHRALRADFPYQYGFSAADEHDPEFRWTEAKAVDVFHASKRWLKIVIGAVAPDAAEHPVRVRVWFNDRLILQVDRRGTFPITRYIRIRDGAKPVMIQIEASRTWRPLDFGLGEDRGQRGVAVKNWEFTDEDPAKGSVTIE